MGSLEGAMTVVDLDVCVMGGGFWMRGGQGVCTCLACVGQGEEARPTGHPLPAPSFPGQARVCRASTGQGICIGVPR